MFGKLLDWYIDRKVRQEREAEPAIDWKAIHDSIREDIDGYTVFLETRDGRFVLPSSHRAESRRDDVVALIVTWMEEGIRPWETEAPAEALAETLSTRAGLSAYVQVSRSLESFAGYYVEVRPLLH
jgi:hypothetical protein